MLLRKIKGTDIYPIGEMVKGEQNNGSGLEQWFSDCGPMTKIAAASPENLIEMQTLGLYPRPTESETLGKERSNLWFNNSPG